MSGVSSIPAGAKKSAPQTLVSTGPTNVAHELGVAPDIIGATLICQTADNGFLVGDRAVMQSFQAGAGPNPISADATYVTLNISSSYLPFMNKINNTHGNLILANWKVVLWWM